MPSIESLTDLGVREAAERIRRGEIASADLTAACLNRIDKLDARVLAWAHLARAGAPAAARERAGAWGAGPARGPRPGVPIGIKDILGLAGLPTTAGAKVF